MKQINLDQISLRIKIGQATNIVTQLNPELIKDRKTFAKEVLRVSKELIIIQNYCELSAKKFWNSEDEEGWTINIH